MTNVWPQRRNMLRGAGVALALPFLESLAPRRVRAQASVPKRLIVVMMPNGVSTAWWEGAPAFGKSVFGSDFTLNNTLAPLAPLKKKTLVLSRLGNYTWQRRSNAGPNIGNAVHARAPAAFLTCTDADANAIAKGQTDLRQHVVNGISFDQVIVNQAKLGTVTPLASLQTGLGTLPGYFDGRSYALNQAISWKSDTQPLKRSISPKAVFDVLVAAGARTSTGAPDPEAQAAAARRAAEEKSVLDAVMAHASSLRNKLGRSDRQVLDQFSTSLRELEKDVTRIETTLGRLACSPIAAPAAVPEPKGEMNGISNGNNGYNREQHADVMNALITMALQCDVTRVVTHMLDDARTNFDYSHVTSADRAAFGGDADLHHHDACQHGQGGVSLTTTASGQYQIRTPSNRGFSIITRWFVRKVAELAAMLEAVPEGDGTMLDHSVIVFGNEERTHDHFSADLPFVLVGGGAGVFKTDGHVALAAVPQDRQVRDLYITIMNEYFGLGVKSFGDDARGVPNASLAEILA